MKSLLTFLLFSLYLIPFVSAQAKKDSTSEELLTLSLEELMNIPVSVASQKAQSIDETPGSITLLTEELIRASRARDLDELLMRVPGFDIANDYGNELSFGVRGNWANEGKILVMVDGLIINETSYGSAPLTQRFPLSHIKQIEIIRGSGSVIYGGVAALAVISIKTKKGNEIDGIHATANSGVSNNAFSRNNAELSFGKKFKSGWNVSLHTGYNQGNNSNRVYKSPVGDSTLDYLHNSGIRSRYANLNLSYKDFELHILNEDLRIDRTNDAYGDKYTYFSGSHIGTSYSFKTKKFTIIPTLAAKSQQPWNVLGGPSETSNMRSYRMSGNLKVLYDATRNLSFMAGSEYFEITSNYLSSQSAFPNGTQRFKISDIAFFSEGSFHKTNLNVTAGFRYDQHSTAGSAFVPRFAVTKRMGIANFKATYSKAFKTPLVYNITLNQNIKPEHVRMAELETSLRLSKQLLFTLNFYDIKIDQSIIYSYDNTTQAQSYTNQGTSGTRGLESELRYSNLKGFLSLNYSFYQAAYHGVASFKIDNNSKAFLGLPTQKLTLTSSFKVATNFSVNPSFVLLGNRTSLFYNNITGTYDLHTMNSFFGLNTVATYDNALAKGLSLSLGLYDVFNQGLIYLPAYNSGLVPQPMQGRELVFKVYYKFN